MWLRCTLSTFANTTHGTSSKTPFKNPKTLGRPNWIGLLYGSLCDFVSFSSLSSPVSYSLVFLSQSLLFLDGGGTLPVMAMFCICFCIIATLVCRAWNTVSLDRPKVVVVALRLAPLSCASFTANMAWRPSLPILESRGNGAQHSPSFYANCTRNFQASSEGK